MDKKQEIEETAYETFSQIRTDGLSNVDIKNHALNKKKFHPRETGPE